jgi:hypothetical protein
MPEDFTPITSQEQLDSIISKRLKDQKDQTQEVEKLKTQLEAKDEEMSRIQREHYRADARRAIVDELGAHGVTEEGRIERILRHVDFDAIEPAEDGKPRVGDVRSQLLDVSRDMPELLTYQLGAGSGGSRTPVLDREKELTEEDIQKMTPEEMAKPGIMERIDRFMAGQR